MRGERLHFFGDWGEHIPPVAMVAPVEDAERTALAVLLRSLGVRDGLGLRIGPEGQFDATLSVPDPLAWDASGRLPCALRLAEGGHLPLWFWFITWGAVDDPEGYVLWWHTPQSPTVRPGACGWWPRSNRFLPIPYTPPGA